MQSKTARIFGGSALIDYSAILLTERLISRFGEKPGQILIAGAAGSYLIADWTEYLAKRRDTGYLFGKHGANMVPSFQSADSCLLVNQLQEIIGDRDSIVRVNRASRCHVATVRALLADAGRFPANSLAADAALAAPDECGEVARVLAWNFRFDLRQRGVQF